MEGNRFDELDLSPLRGCKALEGLWLRAAGILQIDLSPLRECPNLLWLDITENHMKTVDITPLYYCHDLESFMVDETVPLMAKVGLSYNLWPNTIEEIKDRIFWVDV